MKHGILNKKAYFSVLIGCFVVLAVWWAIFAAIQREDMVYSGQCTVIGMDDNKLMPELNMDCNGRQVVTEHQEVFRAIMDDKNSVINCTVNALDKTDCQPATT